MKPKWEPQGMLFCPNLTGPLHIGNALVLWLTAREAAQRGLKLLIRFDDWMHRCWPSGGNFFDYGIRGPLQPSLEKQEETIRSTFAACKLLGVKPDGMYRRSQRQPRYYQVMETLQRAKLVHEQLPGCVRVKGFLSALDMIRGFQRKQDEYLLAGYQSSPPFMAVVDYLDFHVPVHIRGFDIWASMWLEVRIFKLLEEVGLGGIEKRPQLQYCHIPIVCAADGSKLSKSEGMSRSYLFENWSKQFKGKAAIRKTLEDMVLPEGATERELHNILTALEVHIKPNGRRVAVA